MCGGAPQHEPGLVLIEFPHVLVESERRRTTLLAEADHFRLVKLARAARKRGVTRPEPPPLPPDRPERNAGNHDADGRYAVSR
jgi:hypothetical protein